MNNNPSAVTERTVAQQKYKSARANLLAAVILTAVNIVLLLTGSELMLLFSATVPYMAVVFGMLSEVQPFVVGCFVAAAVSMAAYLLCWVKSKKSVGWMVAALVLFVLDTLFMVFIYWLFEDSSGMMDAFIHAVILYYLISGVKNGYALKNLPEDLEPEDAPEMPQSPQLDEQTVDSYTDGIE